MDTQAIVEIYMARPQSIACVSMGQWFCDATGSTDKALMRAEASECKRMLVAMGMVHIPDLINKLKEHNAIHESGY